VNGNNNTNTNVVHKIFIRICQRYMWRFI